MTKQAAIFLLFALAATAARSETPFPQKQAGEPLGGGLNCATHPVSGDSASRAPENSGEALGEQRTLITLINFQNDTTTPYTAAQVEAEILDEDNPLSTASWIREVSYGRAWLTGDVIDWTTMPWDNDPPCIVAYDFKAQHVVDALDPIIDFTQYDRWLIFIPPTQDCGFLGYSSLGKMDFDTDEGPVRMSRIIMNGFSSAANSLAAHELGHSMAGLQHSLDYECGAESVGDWCTFPGSTSFYDPYDVMGEWWRHGHFTAPNKHALGWLGPDSVDVPPSGGSYSLVPFASEAPGLKVLRIPAEYNSEDTARTLYYYVSYRTPIGFDADFGELAVDGAMLHLDSRAWVDESVRRSWLLDMSPNVNSDATAQSLDSGDVLLEVGQTYEDVEKGFAITVDGVAGGLLNVTVSRDGYCGNGIVDPGLGEQCDGADLGSATCGSLGHLGGTLACRADCTFDFELCGLALCAPGHEYDPAGSCRMTILADQEDRGLWRSRPSFTETRESLWANNTMDQNWISLLLTQRLDGWTWFHKVVLPFDTTSLPDDASILSATLQLKYVMAGGIENTHPDSADQMVLVQAALANPPGAGVSDYPNLGTLDEPDEGAARIDVGDEVEIGLIQAWPLNPTGLGWIDPSGWTVFGIRTGFDVDNVWFPGVATGLHVQIRSSHSYTVGPRLTVDYASAPEPTAGPAGSVDTLTLSKESDGSVTLNWGTSCVAGDSDYEIYEGTLGDFAGHAPRFCSSGGETAKTFMPASGDVYYFVVPRSADQEGSYGVDSGGTERPASGAACVPQGLAACGG